VTTTYPVTYVEWRPKGRDRPLPDESLQDVQTKLVSRRLLARPITPPLGAWQTLSSETASLDRLRGNSAYMARLGARVEPYGVFWVQIQTLRPDGLIIVQNLPELGKRQVEKVTASLEPDLLYPAVRGADVRRWRAGSKVFVIVVQDPNTRKPIPSGDLKTRCPRTFEYLLSFKKVLETRGSRHVREFAAQTEFYAMFGIGEYTFAPFRVVWARMAGDIRAAVVSTLETQLGLKLAIPTDTTSLIAAESPAEAHYVCALLNSTWFRSFIKSFSSAGRGFGAPAIIKSSSIPRFTAKDADHQRLANFSQRAHELAARLAANPNDEDAKRELAKVEDQVDHAAAELWGLTAAELSEIRKALELLK